MSLRKYRLLIVLSFLSIFSAKMIISLSPCFSAHMDKDVVNSVIMQIELEHGADGDSGKILKYVDYKIIDFQYSCTYIPVIYHFGISSSFLDHNKRYVNPYHPSVPTPPPNLV
ncbi:hypothetical protein [Pedobacter duraquae]|uniref:Uncharacterized protein n=1 Tax=Pedobacter duraquae TaxID=425511 RepID=A0A4R6IIL2_9SPHI|nr:hypothetical protein [Pedobacter duraquae]TDO21797.1 hypothetical protein CLV32_2905 [Pedobacter duraquae]